MPHLARERVGTCSLLVVAVLVGLAAPALGHAALESSEPRDGDRLSVPPDEITVFYAEPPTGDSRFAVTDGCERDVTESIDILNDTITAGVEAGQPGRWLVSWQVVSAVDGHATTDEVSFTVRGEPDCSQAVGDNGGPIDPTGTESSLPLVPIAVATVVIVAIAVAIRMRSRTDQPD